ncbi:MAG: hypothetical protein JEZ14_16055 [Marinilabiliaceae bacterium]|nr:hypothetical protein [Marinilabiliaceae bacterium]
MIFDLHCGTPGRRGALSGGGMRASGGWGGFSGWSIGSSGREMSVFGCPVNHCGRSSGGSGCYDGLSGRRDEWLRSPFFSFRSLCETFRSVKQNGAG